MFTKLNTTLNNNKIYWLTINQFKCIATRNKSSRSRSLANDPSIKDTNKVNKESNADYLGISDTNYKEISGIYEECNENEQEHIFAKYSELIESRNMKLNDQKYLVTTFGRVRLDSDNNPLYHGHFEPNNNRLKFNINKFEEKLKNSQQNEASDQNKTKISNINENNIFEEQYFGEEVNDNHNVTHISSDISSKSDKIKTEFNFIDEQYFSRNTNIEPLFKSKINFKYNQRFNEFLKEKSSELTSFYNFNNNNNTISEELSDTEDVSDINDENSLQTKIEVNSPLKSHLFSQNFDLKDNSNENSSESEDSEEKINEMVNQQMNIKLEEPDSKPDKYATIPRTGAQYLEDLRTGKESPKYPKLFTKEVKEFTSFNIKGEKLDSKGYRILSNQVLDYTKMTEEDIITLLKESILFNDCDFIAINKPYGMSIHSKESNSSPVLTDYLPKLSAQMGSEKLFTVHRLDKDTTGILLLAKTQEKAKELNTMFVKHSIIKRYLCITRGVPDQLEGIIDIPIEIGKCQQKERMVLRPEAIEEIKSVIRRQLNAKRAVTHYKVMSQYKNAALVEVWPHTGVRHQIRVHLGFGLRCPILGDHKYSHLDKIAPQKLTSDMLLSLNVRQAKVRHIPLHLHAMQYSLPGAGIEGRTIFINAPFPHHFQTNMSRLRLRK